MENIRLLGNSIKNLCENRGVSEKNLSDLLGCSVSDISMSLYGRKILSYVQLEKIAGFLNVPVDELFGNTNTPRYANYMDCMNDFTKEANREQVLDIIYDYLDILDAIEK